MTTPTPTDATPAEILAKVAARDTWATSPASRGEWLTRLDVVGGFDGPIYVTLRADLSRTVGGLPVASFRAAESVTAENGWAARWHPDVTQCGGGEWLGAEIP